MGAVEDGEQGSGGEVGVTIGDAADLIGGPLALEHDWDAATGEGTGKVTVAGEGLGTEEFEFGGAPSAEAAENAGIDGGAAQHGHERLTFARGEGVVIVIEQYDVEKLGCRQWSRSARWTGGVACGPVWVQALNGGRVLEHFLFMGDQALHQGRRVGTAADPGLAGENLEKLETGGLAAFRLGRMDMEIRRGGKNLINPGVNDPEGEDGELVVVADEELADQGGDGIQHGVGGRVFVGAHNLNTIHRLYLSRNTFLKTTFPAFSGETLTAYRSQACRALLNKRWQIWKAPEDTPFVTSDNPLVTYVAVSNGEFAPGFGFNMTESFAAFPVAPSACLVIGGNDTRERIVVDEATVRRLNRVVISSSDRYVYSKTKDDKIQELAQEAIGTYRYGENAFVLVGPHPSVREFIRKALGIPNEDEKV